MRLCISNYIHARIDGIGSAFMSEDGTGACISYLTTNSLWLKRFMQGAHQRIGDVYLPNKVVSRYAI